MVVERGGWQADAAASGKAALEKLASGHYDAAIVDLGLPDMSGLEVARRARGQLALSELRLIALTGESGAEVRQAAATAGFAEHLVKPVELDAVLVALGASAR